MTHYSQRQERIKLSQQKESYLAEELIDDAWEADSEVRQRSLALRALQMDPNLIDGYVILGLTMETDIERMAILREGVRRGKIQWADAMKRSAQSYFWQDIHTRPFMRACKNLALLLWKNVERAEAVDLVKLLYRLNPNDNQGVRYLLMAWLPVLGDWSSFERTLKRSAGEGTTEYLYSACLSAYRSGTEANNFLTKAMEANPFVPRFLNNAKLQPKNTEFADFGVAFGSESEAFEFARMNRDAWSSVLNATKWLQRETAKIS
jgi:hypothetical protein